MFGIAADERDGYVGVLFMKVRQHRRQHIRRHRRAGPDVQPTGTLPFEGIQVVFELTIISLNNLRVAQGYLTGAGQTDLLARPLKKRQTYLLLQFLTESAPAVRNRPA